jgi:hypothetical protein
LTLDQVVTELERRTRSAVPADLLAPPRVVQTA